ncbi:MAG: hypothetical protein HY526_06635 [Betaproteobacteria bacterium]|nr:hypothetical protein [Betaproteobacteria bacterium]
MMKALSAVVLSLMSFFALAAELSEGAPAPIPDADPTAMIVFVLVFVGMVGGFGVYIWMKERERKGRDGK